MYYVHLSRNSLQKNYFPHAKESPIYLHLLLCSLVSISNQQMTPPIVTWMCITWPFFFFSSIKMFKDEELCALSHHWVEPPLTMSYAFIQGSWFAYQKKWFEAILLFKFFQLWIERAQNFQIFSSFWGEKNSLKINKFQDYLQWGR